MLIRPRDYQIKAHETTLEYLNYSGGNGVVAMPTGTGKSVNIAMFCYDVLTRLNPAARILKLTHVKELIEQNAKRLLAAWPEAPLGIFSAGLKTKQLNQPITFAGVASAINVVDKLGAVDYLLIDECHLISPHGNTIYREIIATLLSRNPHMRVIGYTATPYRMGQGMLTERLPNADAPIFTHIAVDMVSMEWFNWFISQQYLSKLVTMATHVVFDTSGVGTSNGDFTQKALIDKLNLQDREHEQACREMVAKGAGRRKWLVFTAGIERAEWVSDRLNSLGIRSTFVHSQIEPKERVERIADFRAGKYQCMCGNNIFTTGFDDPEIDLIGMFRPTKSPGLWVQMLGRGTRPVYAPGYDLYTIEGRFAAQQAGGKRDCLVLDFAKNTVNLGPVNDPRIPGMKTGTGDIPMKICPSCGAYNHLSARTCEYCGEPFPPGSKLTAEAFAGEIIRTEDAEFQWYKVDTVIYRVHQKGAGKPCVRVTYNCAFRQYEEWLFIEDQHHLGKLARDWWRTRVKDLRYLDNGPPPTAADLVKYKDLLKTPTRIQVHTNHKPYPEIVHYEYE